MKKVKITELRQYLSKLSDKELENEIVTLVKNYPSVNKYFAVKIDGESIQDLIAESKEKILRVFYPSRGNPSLNFRFIGNIIKDMKKLTDNKKVIINLILYAVKVGIQFTNEFGDVEEKYYVSLINLFYDALQLIAKENLEEEYMFACDMIVSETRRIGWGFPDAMESYFYDFFDHLIDEEE